jgi:Spy/CpxP family protein refolding chaperone
MISFTKTKILVAIIIVLSAIILAVFATMGYHYFRYEQESKNRPRESQRENYMAKQLQLTPNQISQFDSLCENFHEKSSVLMKDSKDISKDILEELISEKPDTNKLKAFAARFGKIQEQQKQMMINHLLEVKGKCNPSQHMNFKRLIQQMEKHDQRAKNHAPADKQRK